jgi:hypothetical protein
VSHIAAGVCGGLVVVAGGKSVCSFDGLAQQSVHVLAYSWYHFSGWKKTVDATKGIRMYLEKSQQTLADRGRTSSNVAFAYLRKAAKSYVAIVPGAESYVDSMFDSVDEVFDAHQEEASVITQRAYDEIQTITRQNNDSLQTAVDVMGVLKKYLIDLHGLGMKAGENVLSPMWDRYPAAKEKLDGAFDELRRRAENGGPAARRIFDETQQQVGMLHLGAVAY